MVAIERSILSAGIYNTVKSENKPRGLHFSKAPFEGLIFGGAYIRRGLSREGNLRFKIDWASLTVGRLFCVTSLGGLYLEGLLHGGAFFRNFTVIA